MGRSSATPSSAPVRARGSGSPTGPSWPGRRRSTSRRTRYGRPRESSRPAGSANALASLRGVGLVFGCIAPHGGIAIAEACPPERRDLAAATRPGMEELGRRFDRAPPAVLLALPPPNLHT